MKYLFLILPLFLVACDGNKVNGIDCIDGVLYIQVGVVGTVYKPTETKCIDIAKVRGEK
jgi:hypothetical protein